MTKVYCSGPLFSPADRWEQAQIAAALEAAGYDTYLPQRDGISVGAVIDAATADQLSAGQLAWVSKVLLRIAFCLDIYQLLEGTDAVVFNMNGRVPDEGSVVEVATAAAAGIPLVIYKSSVLGMFSAGGADNPMLTGLDPAWEYATSMDALAPMLADRVAAQPPSWSYQPPPYLARVVAVGQKVWEARESLPTSGAVAVELRAWLDRVGETYLEEL